MIPSLERRLSAYTRLLEEAEGPVVGARGVDPIPTAVPAAESPRGHRPGWTRAAGALAAAALLLGVVAVGVIRLADNDADTVSTDRSATTAPDDAPHDATTGAQSKPTSRPPGMTLSRAASEAAERFMQEAVGDRSTTQSVQTITSNGSGPDSATIRVQTTSGAFVDAEVECDTTTMDCRVLGVASPGFSVSQGAGYAVITAPVAGRLTVTLVGEATMSIFEVILDGVRVEQDQTLRVPVADSGWLRIDLVGDDGKTLRYLRPR